MRREIDVFGDQVRLISGRHGGFFYNPNCTYIGRALELYGEYCEKEVELFRQLLKPTDCVWEIGANMGSQAVPLAKIVHQGNYVGFEPQVELFKILTANLLVNQLTNARSMNIALGDQEGVLQLPAVNYARGGNFGAVSLLGENGLVIVDAERQPTAETRVRVFPIDHLSELPDPDFIKMDVEGMELMVLSGGQKLLERKRPIIFAENERSEESGVLIRKLWEMNYECYWIVTPYYNPDNFFKNSSNFWERIYAFNILCFPQERGLRVEGVSRITDADHHPLRRG